MYKAIDRETGQEIIILSQEWRTRLSLLREWGRWDRLICQSCRQPMRVKAGRFKRRHFAHKHLEACSLGSESPEILSVRAVLYERLTQVFPQGVTLEKLIESSGLPRPIDCVVEIGQVHLAYWIIDTGIRLDMREKIQTVLQDLPYQVTWVLTANLLHDEAREPGSLHLSPTERAFVRRSDYDGPAEGDYFTQNGQTLHYLDAGEEKLTTYRGLKVIHLPQWYQGMKIQSNLVDVAISRINGEFVHPGEDEKLAKYTLAKDRKQTIRHEAESRLEVWNRHGQDAHQTMMINAIKKVPARKAGPVVEAAVCVLCGQVTTDWWVLLPGADKAESLRRCKCRECLKRGL